VASFDFESGLSGAQTGSAAGPWGALAGFVISGFMGGSRKGAMRKALAKKRHELMGLASPKHLADVTQQLTPQFRQQVAGGAGAEASQAITDAVARRGLSGTGIGTALEGGAAAIPEIMAFKESLGTAKAVVTNQMNTARGLAGSSVGEYGMGDVDRFGNFLQNWKQLSVSKEGPAGGLKPVGDFTPYTEEPGPSDQSASDIFSDPDKYNPFAPRR
jgi:hypothetical protein